MSEIDVICWDTGGVLIPDQGEKLDREVAEFIGVSPEEYAKKIGPRKREMSIGKTDLMEVYAAALAQWGRQMTAQEVLAEHMRLYGKYSGEIDPQIQRLIRDLEQNGYKSFYVTNTEREIYEFNKGRDLWGNYPDGGLASVEVGAMKPEPQIYKAALRVLHLEDRPGAAVFIDDKEKYTKGAEEAGMQTILYPKFGREKELRGDLRKLGVRI